MVLIIILVKNRVYYKVLNLYLMDIYKGKYAQCIN